MYSILITTVSEIPNSHRQMDRRIHISSGEIIFRVTKLKNFRLFHPTCKRNVFELGGSFHVSSPIELQTASNPTA